MFFVNIYASNQAFRQAKDYPTIFNIFYYVLLSFKNKSRNAITISGFSTEIDSKSIRKSFIFLLSDIFIEPLYQQMTSYNACSSCAIFASTSCDCYVQSSTRFLISLTLLAWLDFSFIFNQTACIPASKAGSTSLSQLSPTIVTSAFSKPIALQIAE